MMDVVHDLRADREGIWELHLDAVQRALYLFAAFDCTNNLRWCSVYLEDKRRLSHTAPSLHSYFSNGNFSIRVSMLLVVTRNSSRVSTCLQNVLME